MSTRKQREKEAKKNERLRQGVLAGAVAAPVPATAPQAVSTTPTPSIQLRPEDELILQEIRLLAEQVNAILRQASMKIAARALIEGMKEAGTDSSVK